MLRFLSSESPLVLALALALAIVVVSFGAASLAAPAGDDAPCPGDFWARQLGRLDAHLDESAPPCEDFFEFACGNWRAPYALRSLRARDTLTALRADNTRLLLEFLEHADDANETASGIAVAAKASAAVAFFQSCLDDRAAAPKQGGLRAYAEALLGVSDWPVLNPYYPEGGVANASFHWQHVSGRLRRLGVQSFWRLLVQPNWQAAEQQILYLAPPRFDLLPGHGHGHGDGDGAPDEEQLFLYKRYVKYLMLDLDVRVRKAARIADEVLDFELELRALARRERDVELRAPRSLAALQRELPALELDAYFAALFAEEAPPGDFAERLLLVADAPFLRRLAALLRRTRPETLGKFLLVRFLAHFEVHLHEGEGFQQQKQDCLQRVHELLPQQLTRLFLELQRGEGDGGARFLRRTERELGALFEQLRRQFELLLNATHIFDRDAVSRALGQEKLRAMRLLLPAAAPDAAETEAEAGLALGRDYDRNLLRLARLRVARELAPIVRSLASTAEGRYDSGSGSSMAPDAATPYGPLSVNAFYRLRKNAVELPVGLLRAPLYDRCLAPAHVHGGLVYVLAHELLHGFDYDGLNYDQTGSANHGWGPKAVVQFGVRSSCFLAERYRNATLNINENIADSEGLRLALEAFVAGPAYDGRQREALLRRFFTSFAQTWCGSEAASGAGGTAMHASHRERVNNVVANFPEFAEVFGCREGAALNPAERCRIW